MDNLQTQLLGKRVQLKEELRKSMSGAVRMYTIETVYVENGVRMVISDEYGSMKTVTVDEVELHKPRSW